MEHDNYLSEYDEDLKAGDILVYDNGLGGSSSIHFLKIVSFVPKTKTPRVVPLINVYSDEKLGVFDREYTVTPGKPKSAISYVLNKTKGGLYTWKKDCLRPCHLELYNPERKYKCIHYEN